MLKTLLPSSNKTQNFTSIPPTTHYSTQNDCRLHGVSASEVLYALFMALVLLASIIGNLLVVIAVWKSPGLRRKVASLFIGSLACADFIYAVFLIPFRISIHLHGTRFCHSLPTCYWFLMSDALCNTVSILSLLVLAIDRYVAIKYPFQYQDILTRKRAKLVIAVAWIFAAAWGVVGVINWNTTSDANISVSRLCNNSNKIYYLLSFLGVYITSLLIMTCVYVRIFHIAISHIKSIENSHSRLKREENGNNISMSSTNKKPNSRKRGREMKTTKSIAIVYGAFIVCWLPSCIIVLITNLDELALFRLRTKNETAFLFIYYAFIEVLPVLNTAMNPFIYSFSNKQFRTAFSNVISRMIMRQRLAREISTSTVSSSRSKKTSVVLHETSRFGNLNRAGRIVVPYPTYSDQDMLCNERRRGWSQTSLALYECSP